MNNGRPIGVGKSLLFKLVKCHAYMKPAKDGVHIVLYNGDGTVCLSNCGIVGSGKAVAYRHDPETHLEVEIKDLSDFDGSGVEKTYMTRIEKEFEGVVVGLRKVKVRGIIGTDWNDDPYGGDFGYCFKETTEAPTVAVVYYKNNCKRLVLPEDLEVIG